MNNCEVEARQWASVAQYTFYDAVRLICKGVEARLFAIGCIGSF